MPTPTTGFPTRLRTAGRYLRMDRAYAMADSLGRITDSTRAQVNRTFDRATLSFFGGRFAAAVASIDSSVQQLATASRVAAPTVGAVPALSAFPGDARRTITGPDGAAIPMRLIVPPAAAASRRPLGVLLALHGAGGDENMFVDAYGQGIAARLAGELGLILVSPTTAPFVRSAAPFDSVLATLRREYAIDTTRVVVIGHSMGAGAAASLARARPSQIAAVVCLAGGAAVTVAGAPPMLFIGAALDPIIPAARVRAAAEATPTGRYEELDNEGHTLMVRRGVQRGLAWLAARPTR
ncbi:MAG: alpha/beta hydrolase [Gemmatimonadaceae bacterium]|nr:alpha/beta hydrolase [Gemmatimonadaceae bacterium]